MIVKEYVKKAGAVLFLLFFILTATVLSGQTLSVEAPNVVEKGEVFRIVYSADNEVADFKLPSLQGLELLAGPIPSRTQSTNIINGKRTDYFQVSYSIMVRAQNTGVIKIEPAQCSINGSTVHSKSIEIEVVEGNSGEQQNGTRNDSPSQSTGEISSKDIFLRLSFSKNKVVKGEPIVATLKLYTKVPVAGFEDVKFPVFNGFWSQELETPQNINFERESYDNQIYNSAVLRRYMLLPQQTGKLTIDPAYMVCQVQVRMPGGGRTIFDSFFDSYQTLRKRISTQQASITVLPLPSGAPASFGGGVGEFSLSVKLSRDSIKAHEAGSLMVEVSGKGNLNLIEPPTLLLPNDFEKYDVKSEDNFANGASGFSGKKSFEYPFIPRSKGIFKIPPVEYTYYSISQNRYVTLRSDTLSVKVLENDNASVSSGQNVIIGVNKQSVVNLGSDIRYIFTTSAQLSGKGVFLIWSWKMAVAILLIAALFALVDYMLGERAKLRGDVKRTRNRKANKIAGNRLKLARSYMEQKLYSPFYEELHKALLGYISDKLAIQFADMQRDTIEKTLLDKDVSQENIASFMTLLDECEMARYSQSRNSGSMETQYNSAIEIISNFENRL